MSRPSTNIGRDACYGALQDVVDALFEGLGAPEPDGAADAEGGSGGRAGGDAAGAAEAAAAFGTSERTAALLGLGALLEADSREAAPQVAGAPAPTVRRLDVVLAAEAADLPEDLLRIVRLLPPGDYTRDRLCVQLNSAITGHAWGQVYGTVS